MTAYRLALRPGAAAADLRVGPGDGHGPAPVAKPAVAVNDPVSESIRERVDHLRYQSEHGQGGHDVNGERIVLGDTVARYYESQQFRPQWRDRRGSTC